MHLDQGDIDWTDQAEVEGRDKLTDSRNHGVRWHERLVPRDGAEVLAGVDLDVLRGEVRFRDPDPANEARFEPETWRILSPYLALSQLLGDRGGVFAIPSVGVRTYARRTARGGA